MNSRQKRLALLLVLAATPALAMAQDHGSGGGESGGGCGDVLGDLVHIKRHKTTGQPILQKRTIEDKGVIVEGFCPIPVRGNGTEIGFATLSCDPLDPTAVVEVDYFGRLSGGRTKERNGRMHFDEVISSIKDPAVGWVTEDETGRLLLGYDCVQSSCSDWRTVDSPMENLALYARVLKYGHLQTDPMEVDVFAHGDPAAGVQYHPALTKDDYSKFDGRIKHLLPNPGDPGACWLDDTLVPACAANETLDNEDFVRASSYLAGAASKTGTITPDLVQYMNRILKVARATEITTAPMVTLPALIRDCGPEANAEALPATVLGATCTTEPASPGLRAPADERFVDFGSVSYVRKTWRENKLSLLQRKDVTTWKEVSGVKLMEWLAFINPTSNGPSTGIDGFVLATSDGLRSIEFVHNYAIPEDLWPNLAK